MNENLRSKITSRLNDLTDEGGRQLLDYTEFLLSKYNRSRRAPSTMQRIAEGIEDKLGPNQIADAATKGASQVIDALDTMISGIAAAAKTVTQEPGHTRSATSDEPSDGEEPETEQDKDA